MVGNTITPSIPSYYVKNPFKLKKVSASSSSSGGATLYLCQDESEWSKYESFFENFDSSNTYRISKDGLKEYLLSVKFEYILNITPPHGKEYSGSVSVDLWNQKYEELDNLSSDFFIQNIQVEKHVATSPNRLYIRTAGKAFDFLRGIVIPDITFMLIKKIENTDKTFTFEFSPILREDLSLENSKEQDDEFPKYDFQNGVNLILYGAPGTGKSHELDKRFGKENCLRVTFHPEYTYNDFIGSYRPEPMYKIDMTPSSSSYKFVNEKKEEYNIGEPYINYKFVPGPFTVMLEKAISSNKSENPQMFTLIIEELNRANAPAVFGDLFQLLDRDTDGNSTYSVTNLELVNYFQSKGIIGTGELEIRIPSNLNIVATMNSADQGVYVMDSAFKRRWAFEYMPILPEEAIHKDELVAYNEKSIRWADFITNINKKLAHQRINEDRHIGPYFLKSGEPSNMKMISSKLLMYLWDDVVRINRSKLFLEEIKTFSQLVNLYEQGKPVFQIDFDLKKEIGSEENEEKTE